MDRPLVVLDTETATLRGAPHLLELAALRIVDGEVADRFEALVRPQVAIEPEATAIHGIDESMILAAGDAGEVLERFGAWVGDDWMVAHNAEFDARVLGFECARWRVEPPPGVVLDTLRLARKLIPEAPDHKLETLCHFLELEDGEHHRALADAAWCWQVLEHCIERLGGAVGAAQLLARCGTPVTIERWRPRVARALKPRLRPLERACHARERVTLVYGDGEAPPVPLAVLPHFVYDLGEKSYLEAQCLTSGLLKTYRLDRVHKVV